MEAVDALCLLAPVGGHREAVVDGDPPDHQHVVIGLDLADSLDLEPVAVDFDLTRFQRAGKRAGQSAAGSGHHVVERGRVRRELLW
jgi:hypothetical protein